MRNYYRKFAALLVLVPVLGWAEVEDHDMSLVESDTVVTAKQVPAAVLSTAKSAKPGAYFVRIMRQLKRDDEYYYVFDASQVGKYWTIKVRADGVLIEVNEAVGPPVTTKD